MFNENHYIVRTDLEIKEDVLEELLWQPNVNQSEIGVIVTNGIVTLMGIVNNYAKKMAAEEVTRGVVEVIAVAEEIAVNYDATVPKSHTEIALTTGDVLKDKGSTKVEPE